MAMEVTFTLTERLQLSGLVQEIGDKLIDYKRMTNLREKLGLDDAEIEDLELTPGRDWSEGCPRCGGLDIEYPGPNMRLDPDRRCKACGYEGKDGAGKIFWNTQKADAHSLTLQLSTNTYKLLKGHFQEMDNNGKLPRELAGLAEKLGVKIDEDSLEDD